MLKKLRKLVLGKPIPTSKQHNERLSNLIALPVFSSDAVSSVAYGPQEVLIAMAALGSIAFGPSLWIGAAIAILIAIVSASYRQTVFAYPHGGGSYTVAKENLGTLPGLIAAAALLTDYILTVAVSVSAGVAAIIAAWPTLEHLRVPLCLLAVALVALANLRGIRESGALFAGPTYLFIVSLFTLVIVGIYKAAFGPTPQPIVQNIDAALKTSGLLLPTITLWLVLRAFSSGCSALTGIEAIANGVPAFRAPESRNAAKVMVTMALILALLVLGITFLAHAYHTVPGDALKELQKEAISLGKVLDVPNLKHLQEQTVLAMLAERIFGRGSFSLFWVIQFATMAILILAANTAFQDFPRLGSILAKDRFAPRQLANLGDRLVFTNGISFLALVAALLLIRYKGETTQLIPLYAVGVFISFTLSQAGMLIRQRRLKHKNWVSHSMLSGFGAVITGIVAVMTGITKFTHGAWMVIVLIIGAVIVFRAINKHYTSMGNQLRVSEPEQTSEIKSTAIVLTAGLHKGVIAALKYGATLSHDCRALYVEIDPAETPLIRDRWEEYGMGVPLVILESPYRTVREPVLNYLEQVKKERPDYVVTVVLPEFVPAKWWQALLHNQSGLLLKIALMFRRDIVVTNVRYYLDE